MYGASGYDEIIGALDELDALDAVAGEDFVSLGADELEAIAGWDYEGMGIAGYDEIIGADDDIATLMAAAGAAPARRRPALVRRAPAAPPAPPAAAKLAQLANRLAMARKVDPQAVAVVQRPQDRRREFPVGLVAPGPTAFGQSASATALPQVTFRPERLIIPSQIAPFFTIDAIIVGKDNQTVSFDPLPATMFSEVGVGVRLSLKTAVVGMQIIVRFTNVDPLQQARTFSGGIIGTAVE